MRSTPSLLEPLQHFAFEKNPTQNALVHRHCEECDKGEILIYSIWNDSQLTSDEAIPLHQITEESLSKVETTFHHNQSRRIASGVMQR